MLEDNDGRVASQFDEVWDPKAHIPGWIVRRVPGEFVPGAHQPAGTITAEIRPDLQFGLNQPSPIDWGKIGAVVERMLTARRTERCTPGRHVVDPASYRTRACICGEMRF